ncbi:MAG: hypothetical protein ACYS30_21235 [Planctomycetota bacterium]|jgi:hypothetical protein
MYRRIECYHHTLGILILLAIVICDSSCGDSRTQGSYSYRLSRGAYSPDENSLLFNVYDANSLLLAIRHFDSGEANTFLAVYDVEKRLAKFLFPIDPPVFDFAWVPGQGEFVVTHGDRMTLFQKDADGDYRGTAIACPVDLSYTRCSWNPKGEWLAVNCNDLRKGTGRKLGLYELKEERFVMSDIVIDHRPLLWWEDDSTLYAPKSDKVLEVELESGAPRLIRTIPIKKGMIRFHGMFDDKPLISKMTKIALGNRTLVRLDDLARNRQVITTKKAIFVSASSTKLVVFDHKGREINRMNPGRKIQFGPVGKDPNTVYGLDGSMLLRVSLENGSLNIEEVVDLSDESIQVLPGVSK